MKKKILCLGICFGVVWIQARGMHHAGIPRDTPSTATASTVTPTPRDTTGVPTGSTYFLDMKTFKIEPEEAYWTMANKRNLPFDAPFSLVLKNMDNLSRYKGIVLKLSKGKTYNQLWTDTLNKTKTIFTSETWDPHHSETPMFSMPPLRANQNYILKYECKKGPTNEELNVYTDKAIAYIDSALLASYTNILNCTDTRSGCIAHYALNDNLFNIDALNKVLNAPDIATDEKNAHLMKDADIAAYKASVGSIGGKVFELVDTLSTANLIWNNTSLIELYSRLNTGFKARLDSANPKPSVANVLFGISGTHAIMNYRDGSNASRLLDTLYTDSLVANYTASLNAFAGYKTHAAFKNVAQGQDLAFLDQCMAFMESRRAAAKNLSKQLKLLLRNLKQKRSFILNHLDDIGYIPVNTSATFRVRSKWYFCPDVGMAVVFRESTQSLAPYYGLNISFLPINREQHYSILNVFNGYRKTRTPDCPWYYRLAQGMSFVAGVTMQKTSTAMRPEWHGVIGDYSLLTGIGLRLNDYLRICGGAIYVNRNNPNPLMTDKQLIARPYVSLSLDLDMIGYIQQIFENVTVSKFIKKNDPANAATAAASGR